MIWLMAPDLPEASGGIKMMYRMVEELVAAGYDATIWHGGAEHRYSAFESTAPVHRALHVDVRPGDVLVMHEVGGPSWSFLTGDVPLVMLCQGWVFVLQTVTAGDQLAPGYPGWPNVRAVLPTSAYIERYVGALSGPDVPVHRIPVLVDGEVFRPREKRRVVAYMPRRRWLESVAAIQLLRRTGRLADWEFQAIEGMTEEQVATCLGDAALFISGGEREGFGLPAAEAMAAGCYVVGFAGEGGTEFVDPAWATVVHDSDVLALADGLTEAARSYDEERPAWQERVDRGRAVVLERYNRAAMRSALAKAFGEITAPGSAALVTVPATVPHYQTHAPAPGWRHEGYRWARRTARRTFETVRDRTGP